MAKMLKQLVFGQKKNPPAPPRPDYEGDKSTTISYDSPTDTPFLDHDYENISKFKCRGEGSQVHFVERKEVELRVFDDYSEPADLRAEISTLEADPLYMSPLDDRGTAPPLEQAVDDDPGQQEDEDMYCVPYDDSPEEIPPLPQPCLGVQGRPPDNPLEADATYDVVPDIGEECDDDAEINEGRRASSHPVEDEYDEPWEWSVAARLTHSLQVSPVASLGEEEDLEGEDTGEEETMTARQQRRLLYETAFDSRVRRDADDLDRLIQHGGGPLFLNGTPPGKEAPVARAASRSSFGSTSGSSASSTPTHQPMEIAPRQSPRHFTPTERRRVTLIRDCLPRSGSPQPRPKPEIVHNRQQPAVVNQNFERKISFNQWDSASRCSGSDKSSSQESMSVEPELGRSSSRDGLDLFRDERRNLTSNYPNNWKELSSSKLEDGNVTNDLSQSNPCKDPASFDSKRSVAGHPTVKVLPNSHSSRFSKTKSSKSLDLTRPDPELKENESSAQKTSDSCHHPRKNLSSSSSRHSGLLSEVRPMDNLPQSPENDERTSGDYDPPWDAKIINTGSVAAIRPSGVNASLSVPDKLFSSGQPKLPTSLTQHKLDSAEGSSGRDASSTPDHRPNGLSQPQPRLSHLNLNLGSDSPRKARQNLTLNFGCAALGAVGEKVDSQLTLEKQGWYHGSISRVDAEAKLRVLKEGSYLVRNSESSKQDYSLSLKSARGFMHMKIVPTSEGGRRFILGQFSNPFSSIPEMIQHYSVNKLPIKGAEHMSLLYPVIDQLL